MEGEVKVIRKRLNSDQFNKRFKRFVKPMAIREIKRFEVKYAPPAQKEKEEGM